MRFILKTQKAIKNISKNRNSKINLVCVCMRIREKYHRTMKRDFLSIL